MERTMYLHSGHGSLKLPGSYHIESLYMYHYKILLHIQYRPKIHSFSLRNIENDNLGDDPYFLLLHIFPFKTREIATRFFSQLLT